MATETIYVRATRQQMRDAIRKLPSVFAGKSPAAQDISYGLALRMGVTVMSFIRTAFITKARGGTDEAGEKWQKLAPSTIARRLNKAKKTGRDRRRIIKQAEQRVRDARTEAEKNNARLQTKKIREVFGNPEAVEILRDDGTMYNSISPGVSGELMPGGELRIRPGEALAGTNVPYAIFHHSDEPRKMKSDGTPKLPQRRLWPKPEKWPVSWWAQVRQSSVTGVIEAVKLLVSRGFGWVNQ